MPANETTVVRCPSCRLLNRLPKDKIARGLRPRCGQCKATLPASTKPITVSDATFEVEVERSPLPVVLDLWAPWCGPCRMMAPILDELASEMAGQIRVAKLNVDENPSTAARFNAMSIPTLVMIREGREIDRIIGAQPKAEIARRLVRAFGTPYPPTSL